MVTSNVAELGAGVIEVVLIGDMADEVLRRLVFGMADLAWFCSSMLLVLSSMGSGPSWVAISESHHETAAPAR